MTHSSGGRVGLKVPGSGMLSAIVISFYLFVGLAEPLFKKRRINVKEIIWLSKN